MAICQVIHTGISRSHLFDYFLGFCCHDGDCGNTWCLYYGGDSGKEGEGGVQSDDACSRNSYTLMLMMLQVEAA
jgi:hypothetical protein